MSATPALEPDRWQRLQQLFEQALAIPADDRAAFVARTCGDDAALAQELSRLLASADEADETDLVHGTIGRAAARWAQLQREAHVGERLGPWRITAHLADGGMGAVFVGERADGQYEQRVAIKLLNPAQVGREYVERMALERRILARLHHPHIARLLDGGSTALGVPYLVMEFVDGMPIDAWCRAHAPDLPTRLRLMAQVARAVDHAHRNLVVHRDLKPSNLLVDAEGAPRLLDFGIAKRVDIDAGLTVSGEMPLTPTYASPEQVNGTAVTVATDVYALGVLLYQLLTGLHPHHAVASSAAALARAIVETEPVRPSQAVRTADRAAFEREFGGRSTRDRIARGLEGDLDNIVLTALRKEAARRYASAAELADDIDRHLAHLPVRARPDTLAYRSAKLWRRHPVAVPATAAALVAAVLAGSLFTLRLAQERDAALQAQATSQQTTRFLLDMFAAADPFASSGENLSVPELLRRGVARVDEELAGQPEVRARLLHSLGAVHLGRGEYREAVPLLRRALEVARPLGRREDLAEYSESLGVAIGLLGDRDEALLLLREAVAMRRAASVPNPAALSSALYRLGWLRMQMDGDLAEAVPLFDEALALLRRSADADSREATVILNALGVARRRAGDAEGAIAAYREVVAIHERAGRPKDPMIGTAHMNIGVVLHSESRGIEAEPHYLAALAHIRSHGAPGNRFAVEPVLANMAKLYIEAGRLAEAEPLLQESMDLVREQLGESHPFYAYDLVLLGAMRRGQQRLDESMAALDRALAIYDVHAGLDPSHRLVAVVERAWTLLEMGQPVPALALLDEVVETYDTQPVWLRRGLAAHARSLRGAALLAAGQAQAGREEMQAAHDELLSDVGAGSHLTRAAAARLATAPGSIRSDSAREEKLQ